MQKLIPAFLFALLAFVSCTKSDDEVAKNPTWVVSSYLVQGTTGIGGMDDKTSLFNGYTFEFNDDDKMVIHKPDGSVADAKWAVDDFISTTVLFGMDNPFAPVDAILGTWPVNEQTDTDLKLERTISVSTALQPPAKLEFKKQ